MLLKRLSEGFGVSGNEKEIRDILKENLKENLEKEIDKTGNLIVKKGNVKDKKIVVMSNIDEIGLMVTKITNDGLLKFTTVGNFDPRILVSKEVTVGENRLKGVIGAKPIHLQTANERKKTLKITKLYIDIGVESKVEASRYINIGDYVSVDTKFKEISGDLIKGKALESRVPTQILLELLNDEETTDFYGVFSTMKEVGIIAGGVGIYNIDPEYLVVLTGVEGELGKGPIISLKDVGSMYNRDLFKKILDIAKEKNIKIQISGNDDEYSVALRGEVVGAGNKTIKIGIPCKYMKTPANIVDLKDYEETKKLIKEIVNMLGGN